MDRGNGSLPSCHMTSKRSVKTPMNRRIYWQNLKGVIDIYTENNKLVKKEYTINLKKWN